MSPQPSIPSPREFSDSFHHRAPKILYYYENYLHLKQQILEEREHEKNALLRDSSRCEDSLKMYHYLPSFLHNAKILQNMLPLYSFLNKNHLNKEISEAGGIVTRLERIFALEQDQTEERTAFVQNRYCLFDIGSGRGYISVFTALRLPHIHRILMLDRCNKMDLTHLQYFSNIQFQWVYLRGNGRNIGGGRHLERNFGELVRQELHSASRKQCFTPEDCTMEEQCTAITTAPTFPHHYGIIFGCHLCTHLAEIYIECWNQQPDCLHGFVLAPCCHLFHEGTNDLFANNLSLYFNLVEDCLRSGVLHESLREEFMSIEYDQESKCQKMMITSQYKIWTMHLFRLIENPEECDILHIEKDECVMSDKNYFILARRRRMKECTMEDDTDGGFSMK